jgi:hypothetical protein
LETLSILAKLRLCDVTSLPTSTQEDLKLPVWSRHVGDPILASNLTRVDYALFMVEALENDALIHEAPAIVGCQTPSALAARAGG